MHLKIILTGESIPRRIAKEIKEIKHDMLNMAGNLTTIHVLLQEEPETIEGTLSPFIGELRNETNKIIDKLKDIESGG